MNHSCKVCDSELEFLFSARVLAKYDVEYRRCPRCEFVCTEDPYWLDEAYCDAISNADTGLVARNLRVSRELTCLLGECFDPTGRFLDFAGGTGMLVRLMRDIGFNFRWDDRYARNEHSRGFEAEADDSGFEAITAVEVMEHVTDPLVTAAELLDRSSTRSLIFTQALSSSPCPPKDWWYFNFPTGQHISFYSATTMHALATALNVNYYAFGSLHILTGKQLSQRRLRLLAKAMRFSVDRVYRRRRSSLTEADYELMIDRLNSSPS